MAIAGSFAAFLLLIPLITQSECNDKIYDAYFNGHCYWSENVSYHVHHLSGCKVYFTCQRGRFLNFNRCPESTVFNTETLQCDANGICKDDTNVNPTYEAWWKNVVEVIDEVLEALEINSTQKESFTSTNSAETSETKQDVSITVLPTSTMPPQMILNTKETLQKASNSTEELDSTNTLPILNTKPSYSTANTPEVVLTSVHIVPMQFDTQTSLLTENFSSYVTPKASLYDDIAKSVEQLNISYLDAFTFSSNSTEEQNFMKDIIIPIVQDIVQNSTIMSKVTQLFDVVFESADPIMYQILDQQVDEKLGSSINISLKQLKDVWIRTTSLAYPIVKELIRYSMPLVFGQAADNTEVLLDFMDSEALILMNFPSFGTLFDLFFKYRLFEKPLESDQLKTFSLTEIRQDMNSVFGVLSKKFSDKFQ